MDVKSWTQEVHEERPHMPGRNQLRDGNRARYCGTLNLFVVRYLDQISLSANVHEYSMLYVAL